MHLPTTKEMKQALQIKRMQNYQPAKCNTAGYERLSGKMSEREIAVARKQQAAIASQRIRQEAKP